MTMGCCIMNWDTNLYMTLQHWHGKSALLDTLMIHIANDGLYLYALFLLIIWFVGRRPENRLRHREAALSAVIAGVLGLILNIIISHIWFRTRPFVALHTTPLIHHSADASFPSDHTTGSMGLAAGAIVYDRKIGIFFGVFSLLIGFARVYVGVHYPTDVLAGWIIGIACGIAVAFSKRFVAPIIASLIGVWEQIERRIVHSRA